MTKTTTIGLTAIAASAMLALAACGQDAEDASDAAPPETADAAAPEAADAAGMPADVEPERYFGLYGDAANPDELRGMVFVTEAKPPPMAERFPDLPPDYIMIGAMWADVGNYYMKPVSPTRFEQDFVSDFEPNPLVAEFELDADGAPTAVTFEGALAEFGPRARLRDLPEEYR